MKRAYGPSVRDDLVQAQEELLRIYYDVTQLQTTVQGLQASVDEYDQLTLALKDQKRRHRLLKAQCRELKQKNKQCLASEQILREALEV